MNLSIDFDQPEQLFDHAPHAGGWPKLGFVVWDELN